MDQLDQVIGLSTLGDGRYITAFFGEKKKNFFYTRQFTDGRQAMSDRSGLFLEKHLCCQAALFLGDRLTIFQRNRTKLQYPGQGTDSHRDMSDRVGLILEKAYNGLKKFRILSFNHQKSFKTF